MVTRLNKLEWVSDTQNYIRMGSSGTPSTTTSTQTSAPPAWELPYLQQGASAASNLYNNTPGPQYYPGSTVAPQSNDTLASIQAEYNRGANGSPLTSASENYATNNLNSGGGYANNPGNSIYNGVAGSSNPALAQAQASAANTPGSGTLQTLANGTGPTADQQDLQGYASGQYLNPATNPTLQAAVSAANADINNNYQQTAVPGVASSFESGNRFGSGAYQNGMDQANRTLAEQTSNADSNIYAQNYAQEQQNQLAAANSITTANQNQQQIQAGAANSLASNQNAATGLYGQLGQYGSQDQLAAAQGLSGNYTSGQQNAAQLAALSPSLNSQDYTNIGAMNDAGSQLDAYNQNYLNGQVSNYNYNQQLPYQNLQTYMSELQGNNYGGTSSTSTPYYKPSGTTSFLGGAASGAAVGSLFGPWGTVAGGAIGGLSSLL